MLNNAGQQYISKDDYVSFESNILAPTPPENDILLHHKDIMHTIWNTWNQKDLCMNLFTEGAKNRNKTIRTWILFFRWMENILETFNFTGVHAWVFSTSWQNVDNKKRSLGISAKHQANHQSTKTDPWIFSNERWNESRQSRCQTFTLFSFSVITCVSDACCSCSENNTLS